MNTKNNSNKIWLKKRSSRPERMAVPQKASEKYRKHSIVSRAVNTPRRSRRGA